MQFSMKEWRKYYDRVQELGKILKEAKPDEDGNPPLAALSFGMRNNLEFEIKNLMDQCMYYMDCCGVKCPKPLWAYNNKDPRTWYSHKSFAYSHFFIDKAEILK